MHEFVIAYMIDPVEIGQRFTMWPLHMTLMPWFEAPDARIVEQKLSEKLKDIPVFEVAVGERATFGVGKRLPVMLISRTPEIQHLHEEILATLYENNWLLKGRYTGELFTPHVTQKAGRDASGSLRVDAIYIVESQAQNYRQIVGKVNLS